MWSELRNSLATLRGLNWLLGERMRVDPSLFLGYINVRLGTEPRVALAVQYILCNLSVCLLLLL